MLSALPLAAALLASGGQAAGAAQQPGATTPATRTAPPAASVTAATDSCSEPGADSRIIIVCTQRPQGYRLNPDVMEAKRELHSGGRPVRPNGVPPPDCKTVGPFPCVSAGINLIGAALTAAEMAKRVAEGKEIGSMFVTDPHPSEYDLYKMAKARREAEEAAKAVAEKAKAAPVQPAEPPPSGN